MAVTASSVISLQAKLGLPPLNQITGWFVLGTHSVEFTSINRWPRLVVASLYPFMSRGYQHTPFSKFLVYFLGFGPCFVILSISVEGLFYVAYSATLVSWVIVESIVRNGSPRLTASKTDKVYRFQPDDLRIAVFFLFFVQVGFFGTGKWVSDSIFSKLCTKLKRANSVASISWVKHSTSTYFMLTFKTGHSIWSPSIALYQYSALSLWRRFWYALRIVFGVCCSNSNAILDIQNSCTLCHSLGGMCFAEWFSPSPTVLPFACCSNSYRRCVHILYFYDYF